MRSTVLTELPMAPEEYEIANLNDIDWSKLNSLMSPQQRALVNGLIRYYQPEHILELGVYRGGGTVNILNAIKDWPDSTLTSIDLAENFGSDGPVGDDAKRIFPDLSEDKWKLFTGKDPSEIIDSLGKTFDFVVIDTNHLHPVESLNFLCALPYLKDGAVIVLHDIDLPFIDEITPGQYMAPRILFSSVASPKIELDNIGAFQITPDTRKYISNVFDALLIPWEKYYHCSVISSARNFLAQYYPAVMFDKFDKAAKLNEIFVFSQSSYNVETVRNLCECIPADTIFYGAGQNMKNILCAYKSIGIPFGFTIWDQNSSTEEIHGHPVTVPDFETHVDNGSIIIITIAKENIFDEIRSRLVPLGYTVFHGVDGFFKSLRQEKD